MNIHAVTTAQTTRLPLRMSDLVESEGDEPRIPDLTLADRLGFSKPHNVRKLILRNRDELRMHGEIVTRGNILRRGEKGRGRPGTTYLLNEGQSLVVCALSRTPIAAMIRQDIIAVYMAHRRGEGPTTRQERHALRHLCQHGHVVPSDETIYLDGYGFRAAGTVLIAPVTETVLSALSAFDTADEDDEDGGDREPTLGAFEGTYGSGQWSHGVTDDREFDADSDEGEGGQSDSVDSEPTLGWTECVRQTDLGQGLRTYDESELTSVETHGKGFLGKNTPDDAEPSLGAVNPIPGDACFFVQGFGYVRNGCGSDQTYWGSTGTDDRESDAGDERELDLDSFEGIEWEDQEPDTEDASGEFAGGDRLGADEGKSECFEGKPFIGRG